MPHNLLVRLTWIDCFWPTQSQGVCSTRRLPLVTGQSGIGRSNQHLGKLEPGTRGIRIKAEMEGAKRTSCRQNGNDRWPPHFGPHPLLWSRSCQSMFSGNMMAGASWRGKGTMSLPGCTEGQGTGPKGRGETGNKERWESGTMGWENGKASSQGPLVAENPDDKYMAPARQGRRHTPETSQSETLTYSSVISLWVSLLAVLHGAGRYRNKRWGRPAGTFSATSTWYCIVSQVRYCYTPRIVLQGQLPCLFRILSVPYLYPELLRYWDFPS